MEESCLLFAPKMFLPWFFSSFSGYIVSTLLVKLLIVIFGMHGLILMSLIHLAHVFPLVLFLLLLQYTFLFFAHKHTLISEGHFLVSLTCSCHLVLVS